MATIRPYAPLHPQAGSRPAAPAVRSAQAAFFQQALSGAAPTAAVEPVRQTSPAVRVTSTTTEEPTRQLRPGSLLDIRV